MSNFVWPSLSLKGWSDYRRGCKPPLYQAPTNRVLKARKTLVALTGLPFGGIHIPGANTPVCVLVAPSGLLSRTRPYRNPINSCIRSRISRILQIFVCPKETSGHCFADHWGGNHGRLDLPISHIVCPFRTSIRVIRAECGAETHSASPSTHWYPLNLGYPWSANPFSSFSSFRLFSELLWVRMDFPHAVRFSAGIGPAHFPAARHGYWCQCRCHFHPTFNVVAPLKISQNII